MILNFELMLTMGKCTLGPERTFRHFPVPADLGLEFLLEVTLCGDYFTWLYWNNFVSLEQVWLLNFWIYCWIISGRETIKRSGLPLAVVRALKRFVEFSVEKLWLIIVKFIVIKIKVVILVYAATVDYRLHVDIINIIQQSIGWGIYRGIRATLRLTINLQPSYRYLQVRWLLLSWHIELCRNIYLLWFFLARCRLTRVQLIYVKWRYNQLNLTLTISRSYFELWACLVVGSIRLIRHANGRDKSWALQRFEVHSMGGLICIFEIGFHL